MGSGRLPSPICGIRERGGPDVLSPPRPRRIVESLRGRPGGTSMTKWIGPEEAEYDERRELFNAMIDTKPRIIAACEGPADVREAPVSYTHLTLPTIYSV